MSKPVFSEADMPWWAGTSIRNLAHKAGITRLSVRRIMTGDERATVASIRRVALACRVRPDIVLNHMLKTDYYL